MQPGFALTTRPAADESLAARSTIALTCFSCSCTLEDAMFDVCCSPEYPALKSKTLEKQDKLPTAKINDALIINQTRKVVPTARRHLPQGCQASSRCNSTCLLDMRTDEQILHDRINLPRLMKRLEQSIQDGDWSKSTPPKRETWMKAHTALQVRPPPHAVKPTDGALPSKSDTPDSC